MSFHDNYRQHPSPGLAKAASFSNNPNEKITDAIQTCKIHPEVRIRRNQCPLCAAEQTKKLRRSFHGTVRHRGSANDATASAATAAPKNDGDGDGDVDDHNRKDGRPIDKVTVPASAINPAVARTTGSHLYLEFVDSSQVDIEANSLDNGERQQPQSRPQAQPPQQPQQQSQCRWTLRSQHSTNNVRNDSRHRDCDSNINGNDYTPNNNDNNNNNDDDDKHDDDKEFDTTSQESGRGGAGNVVDGIIHNFLEKMRLLSSQHGRQHQERQGGRDDVETEEGDDHLNDGNFENCGGDADNEFNFRNGRHDEESDYYDDVTDRRGDYTGYIHPQNEYSGNSNDYHGSREECNDDQNSLRGCHGHPSNHHIPCKYQYRFDDDVQVSEEGMWRSRPLEEGSLPVVPVEYSRAHKHSFYSEEPVSGEWKESKPSNSLLNGSELPKPQSQSHHSMDEDYDAIAKPSLKSSLSTLSELQKTILLATQSIGKFSPSEDDYDDRDFVGDDHHPVDEYHDGDDSDLLHVQRSGYDDDKNGIFHRRYERISPSNSLEDNDNSYLPKGLHYHIVSRNKNNDENVLFDDEDCHSRESTDDEGSISSMARREDQPAKRFAESKGSIIPARDVVASPVAEEKNPYVRDGLEDRSQFYQQRESVRTRQVLPQHERQVQEPSEPPLEVDCDSNSSGSSVTMDEFSSSRSLSSKSSSIVPEKRARDLDRLDPIASKEYEAEKESEHAEELKHPTANRVSFTVEDEAGFPEVEGDVPEYDSERLIPKPKNTEENISPCTVILNDDNSEVQLPFGPPFSKVESKSETESRPGNEDSEVGEQPTEVKENSKIPVEEISQMHSQRQGRPTKRSFLRSSLKDNGRSRRSSSGTRVEAEGISGDAEFDETVVSRAGSKSSHQPSFFSALVQNSRQARSHSKTRTRARSRSKSRTRKAAKVVSVEDPKHQAAGKQEEEVSTPVKIDEKENMKDMGVKEDVNLANTEAPQDQVPRKKPSAKIIEPKTPDETPKKRKKSGTKPDPPRIIRGPIAHPYYKLGDVAREEDMIIFPKKNSRSRRRRRRRRRHRSKSRTASLSSSDSSSSSDSDSDRDNDSDDDNLDEREARRKHSIYMSIKELRHLDAAFVKRSDGTWTYAIVCDWIDDEVRFVVNGRGSTKSIPQNIWRSNVRRIKVLSQRTGDNFISKDSASRKKRTIGRGRSSNKSARAKGRMVSPSPTRRTSTMNYMPTIAEEKRYNHF